MKLLHDSRSTSDCAIKQPNQRRHGPSQRAVSKVRSFTAVRVELIVAKERAPGICMNPRSRLAARGNVSVIRHEYQSLGRRDLYRWGCAPVTPVVKEVTTIVVCRNGYGGP